MEGNKDEALKCLRIGKDALEAGDRARALKFLSKARRLDPTLPIEGLLSAAEAPDGGKSGGPDDSAASSNAAPQPDGPSGGASFRARATAASSKANSDGSGSSREYTEEQITIIRQVKMKKDYYQILGLERGCTVEDVKKAYRKLSLKVHPDKNQAPGAEEAFKAVSRAFQCLSNEESRKRYDVSGSDEPALARPAAQRRSHGFNGFYEDDFDADEIFRNFFYGGGPPVATPFGTFQFRTGGMGRPSAHEVHGSINPNLRMLVQILPILLLLLLNFLPSNEPIYTLNRSYPYEHKLETSRGVKYFVKSVNFEEEYPYQSQKRTVLEQQVERDYVGVISQNCRVELQRRQWGLSYQTPHCDMLQKFQTTA
ncbi:chaperone protein dnaJ 49-like [Zingiber officinale]|uniref:chaperone protein dnaJ 49-like n=1 Tax=Zingiber officinale TaxID=94328 RepID=UPI001C4B5BE0|nr:chaperone protein dnaJ 49-like [Zingiber officinale]XP_042387919.1 chaperone protein dnaJ 49-like [Zingiber officinale]